MDYLLVSQCLNRKDLSLQIENEFGFSAHMISDQTMTVVEPAGFRKHKLTAVCPD